MTIQASPSNLTLSNCNKFYFISSLITYPKSCFFVIYVDNLLTLYKLI